MELPSRPKDDRYTRPGQYKELESRLRRHADTFKLPIAVAYAFDHRTRLGPHVFTDKLMLTAGPRAVGAALHEAGFTNLRIVQKQWNPNFRPSRARLGGEIPRMLFISSMQIHSASAYEMIEEAFKLGEERPFILCGGPKAIYEPWDFFGHGRDGQCSADVVVTGEEFVFLELLDRIMEYRSRNEHPRRTFHRLRCLGLLDDIPGLVFRAGDDRDCLTHLVNTGVQRLVQDLDELPHPIVSAGLIEPPHRRETLSRRPIEVSRLHRYSSVMSIVTTQGCKFRCPYCPIPAYNQFSFRFKSPDRLRDELQTLAERTGIYHFFGTDDNFFNNRKTVEEIFECLRQGKVHGKPFRDCIVFGTEATEFDVFKNQDLLPLCRDGGLRGIWFGIEDMTAEFVKKGQSAEKTQKLFDLMNRLGICPMPMMMYHDGQPLLSRDSLYGLLNQAQFLRKAGSVSYQLTILNPAVGSKGYEETFDNQMVIEKAAGNRVEEYQYDGNHCIATNDPQPWRKQLNMYLAYGAFYNPINLARVLINWKDQLWKYRVLYQLLGMAGLVISFLNIRGWLVRLFKGPITKLKKPPGKKFELVSPRSGPDAPVPKSRKAVAVAPVPIPLDTHRPACTAHVS
jgi:radical SAM superfamily enzyme YgiQ (UPF0313 family)